MFRRILSIFCMLAVLVGLCLAADEIQQTCQLRINNGNFSLERKPGTIQIDQGLQGASDVVQSIGTSDHEAVTIGADISTNGVAWFRNLTTNTAFTVDVGVQYGTNFVAFARLKAGEICFTRIHPTNAIRARANGGAVNLRAIVAQE